MSRVQLPAHHGAEIRYLRDPYRAAGGSPLSPGATS